MKPARFWPRSFGFHMALLLFVAWLVPHLLGWRECISVLSGTLPTGWQAEDAMLRATIYLAAYLGAVLLAPAFAFAAAVEWLIRAARDRRDKHHAGKET